MRRGLREVLVRSLHGGRLGWLIKQAAKYLVMPIQLRLRSGRALAGPLMGGIFVTYRCNSDCAMCDLVSRYSGAEMNCAEIKAVIDDMVAIGTSGIGFTGGEPLLRDDIFELICYVKQQGLPITLSTNGLLLNREDLRQRLVAAAPTNINISLDGASAGMHDSLRGGKGLFEKTVSGARSLAADMKAAGVATTLTAVTVISPENADEVAAIAELAADIGFHRIGFMPLHQIDAGQCRVQPDRALVGISSMLRTIRQLPLENSGQYLDAIDQAFAGRPFPLRCNAGFTSLFVDPYGKVAPCLGYVQMGKWSADLRQDGALSKIWRSAAYARIRHETSRCRMCYLNCQAELNFLWPRILS